MKKRIFAVICCAMVFAGYRVAIETGRVARDHSEDFRAAANGAGATTLIRASSDQAEEEVPAPDTEILLVGTLIALAIVAEGLPLRNDCAASINAAAPDGRPRSPAHRAQAPC